MRKIIISLVILVMANCAVYAACPSESEYRAKLHSAADQKGYLDTVTSECIAYFKSTPNPDCSKLPILLSAYMTMYNRHSAVYKPQINGLKNKIYNSCPADYENIEIMFK